MPPKTQEPKQKRTESRATGRRGRSQTIKTTPTSSPSQEVTEKSEIEETVKIPEQNPLDVSAMEGEISEEEVTEINNEEENPLKRKIGDTNITPKTAKEKKVK